MSKKSKITLKNKNLFLKKIEKIVNEETKRINSRYLYQHTYKTTNLVAQKMYLDLQSWYDQYEPKSYTRSADGKNLLSTVTIVKYKTNKKYNYHFAVKLDYTTMVRRVIKNSYNQHLSFQKEDFRLGLIDIITNTEYGGIPGKLGKYHKQIDLFGNAENLIESQINNAEIKEIVQKGYMEMSQRYGIKIKTKR